MEEVNKYQHLSYSDEQCLHAMGKDKQALLRCEQPTGSVKLGHRHMRVLVCLSIEHERKEINRSSKVKHGIHL